MNDLERARKAYADSLPVQNRTWEAMQKALIAPTDKSKESRDAALERLRRARLAHYEACDTARDLNEALLIQDELDHQQHLAEVERVSLRWRQFEKE